MSLTDECTYPLYPIPREVAYYRFQEGEAVHFRHGLGKLNNEIVEEIAQKFGDEPVVIMEVGEQGLVRIYGDNGAEDVVHSVWLLPELVDPLEDYPGKTGE